MKYIKFILFSYLILGGKRISIYRRRINLNKRNLFFRKLNLKFCEKISD
jgi:hypothetical protein